MAPPLIHFVLLLSSVSCNLSFFKTSSPANLKISPTEKIVVLAGSKVLLNCTLSTNRSDITVQNITWQANRTYISSEHYRIVDLFTSQLTVDHVPLGGLTYTCCIRMIPKIWVTSKLIQGGYPPALPANFSCVSPNWTSMTCSWDPIKMNYGIRTIFVLIYKLNDIFPNTCFPDLCNRSQTYNCRCPQNDYETSCSFQMQPVKTCFVRSVVFQFQLTGLNVLGNVTAYYTVETNDSIVKPGPVTAVNWQIHNTSIDLAWAYPDGEISPEVIRLTFMVLYRSQWDTPTTWKIITTDNEKASLKGLTPFTTYTIKIRSKPTRGEYWSDDEMREIRTLTSAPGESPPSTLGSYWSSRAQDGMYSVDIYWKLVPRPKQHGVITHITIQEYKDSDKWDVMYKTSDQVGSDVPQTHDVTYTSHPASVKVVDGNAIQSTIQGLSTRNNYTFLIQAATLDGSSPFPTIIYVPKQSRDYSRPLAVMTELLNDTNYLVTWLLDSWTPVADVESVIIHWCDGAQRQIQDEIKVTCLHDYNWVTASSSATDLLVTLSSNPVQGFQFGVSLIQAGISGGIRWEECLFRRNDDMDPPIPRFEAASNGKQGQITLTWHLSCDAFPSRPLQYQFVYAEVKAQRKVICSGKMLNVTAVSVHGSHDISGLLAMASYSVCMRTVTKHGISRFSAPEFASVVNLVPPKNLTVVVLNDSTLELSWLPAVDKKSVGHYKIVSEPSMHMKKVNGTSSSVILDNLLGYTTYHLSVEACISDLICSITSEAVSVKTTIREPSEVDFEVSFVKNSGMVTINWFPPEPPNGPINQYVISWNWKIRETEQNFNRTVSGNLTSTVINIECPITGAGYTVSFNVWAINIYEMREFLGKRNAPRKEYICRDHNSDNKIIIIVCVVIGMILVVIVVVFSKRKFKYFCGKEVIAIKVPEPLNNQYVDFPDNYRHMELEDHMEDHMFIANKFEKESDSDDSLHNESSKMIHDNSQRESGFGERTDSISKASSYKSVVSTGHLSESDSGGSNTNVYEIADAAVIADSQRTNNVIKHEEMEMTNQSKIYGNDKLTTISENHDSTTMKDVINNEPKSKNQQNLFSPSRETSGSLSDETPVDVSILFESLNICIDAENVDNVPHEESFENVNCSQSNYKKNYVSHYLPGISVEKLPDKEDYSVIKVDSV